MWKHFESFPALVNPGLWPLSGGWPAEDKVLLPWVNWGSPKSPTGRGLYVTEQTKRSSPTLTACASRALLVSDLICLWQRDEPVDRWQSGSPSSANYFCPGPTVPVKKPSMLSVTLSPLYNLSFSPSLRPLHSSLSVLSHCLRQRTLYYFESVLIHLSIFPHLSASVHPSSPTAILLSLSLPRQLWSKLISRWFCEMLIDWTV